jgi:hypothetical protein
MPAMEGRRWSTSKRRVAGHRGRRAARVRAATRGGDVVRRSLREKRSEGRESILCGRVWRRCWELFHGHLVGRGFGVRIVTAVCDMGLPAAAATAASAWAIYGEERSWCGRGVAKGVH